MADPSTSRVFSFAEESCWEGDRFRTVRREIVFVLIGVSARLKSHVRREFTADFGLWYDVDDEWLLEILRAEAPEIDWGYYVFFKKLDHSAITIHHPETNEIVATIIPRGRNQRKLSCENSSANVVHISRGHGYRAERLKREEKRQRDGRSSSGEGESGPKDL